MMNLMKGKPIKFWIALSLGVIFTIFNIFYHDHMEDKLFYSGLTIILCIGAMITSNKAGK